MLPKSFYSSIEWLPVLSAVGRSSGTIDENALMERMAMLLAESSVNWKGVFLRLEHNLPVEEYIVVHRVCVGLWWWWWGVCVCVCGWVFVFVCVRV